MAHKVQTKEIVSGVRVVSRPGEQIEKVYRRHWANFLPYIFMTLAMFIPVFLVPWLLDSVGFISSATDQQYLNMIVGSYVLFIWSFLVMSWVNYYYDIFIVTNERILDAELKTFFTREVGELNLARLQNVEVKIVGFLETLLRFGDVHIRTAGQHPDFVFDKVPHPSVIANELLEIHERLTGQAYGDESLGERSMMTERKSFREVLKDEGLVTQTDIARAAAEQAKTGKRLGEALVDLGMVKRRDIVDTIGQQYNLPTVDLTHYGFNPAVVALISESTARRAHAIAISSNGQVVTVAIPHPRQAPEVLPELRAQGLDAAFVIADSQEIDMAINQNYPIKKTETNGGFKNGSIDPADTSPEEEGPME